MAINIKFDLAGNPEFPTIILATRNGKKLGQLDARKIELNDKFVDTPEISFVVNKYIDGVITNLWNNIVDFKLVYCKEWDLWFEIKVEVDEETETVKTVFGKQLGQAELSQIMLFNIEINTENDIARDDYKITVLYSDDSEASLLNRILEKAPHYSIVHVDASIANIQRTFTFDGTSIYDAFLEISKEIGCLFVYNSYSDENGKPVRTISVYDLEQNCNSCGHRGEYTDVCPKCGSTNIKYGYGNDTLIFVTSDELAAENIQLVSDTDSVKNCFKLEAGDDLMTATIRNCNPNGTDYIWRISDFMKEDMSDELVSKLESYDNLYKEYYTDKTYDLDSSLLNQYNSIVSKYSVYNEDLQQIATPIKGYPSLMTAYYNVIDLSLYLESGLMPNVETSVTNANAQANLLTSSSLSPTAVANIGTVSQATSNSAILAMAKTLVKSGYKVEINTSELSDRDDESKTWKGSFVVTNYSDESDTATSSTISVVINGDDETFINQKLEKALSKENTEDVSISDLFKKDYDSFCAELKKYALNPLISFHDACQACLDILIEQGVASDNTWSDTDEDSESNLYEELYIPYYNKLLAIESEMKIREDEINIVFGKYDSNGNLITNGLGSNIEKIKKQVQDILNFEKYLGTDLWYEFCTYRREDKYSNDNYISDGLDNAELFNKAMEFVEVAENEIYKSSELQYSITTNLKNLLAIEKFKPLIESFETGNWIRIRIDDCIYKLRLLDYNICYDDFSIIPVVFSNVSKIKNGITDVKDILSQASSMATSYDSVKHQSKNGNEAQGTIEKWLSSGLNSALVQIQNNDTEEITLTKNGLLCRSYNDITDSYSPEQLKITHNIMAYTNDDWKSVKQAIGKHSYTTYDSSSDNWVTSEGYGVSADFVSAGQIMGSTIVGGDIYSDNYSITDGTGSYLNLRDGTFSFGGGSLRYEDGKLTLSSPDIPTTETITEINEEYLKTTSVYAENLQVGAANISGTLTADQIDADGIEAVNVNISGTINSTSGTIGGWIIGETSLHTDGATLDNDVGSYLGTDGIRVGSNFSVDDSGNAVFSGDITGSTFTLEDDDGNGNFSINADGVIETKELAVSSFISTEDIYCTNVHSPYHPKTLISNLTIYVDADNGSDDTTLGYGAVFQTLQSAIDNIPKFMNGKNVNIELRTDIVENININYFTGGSINIYLAGNSVYGYITSTQGGIIRIYGGTIANKGVIDSYPSIHPYTAINVGGRTASITARANTDLYICYLNVYGADILCTDQNGSCASMGVCANATGYVYVSNVKIFNLSYGFGTAGGGGRIHCRYTYGIADVNAFAAYGGYISLEGGTQAGAAGGEDEIMSEWNGGIVKSHSISAETGDTPTTSTEEAPVVETKKTATYTSTKGNAIQYYGGSSAKWRSDNSPKVGTWGYGNHVAYWFFGNSFENIADKEVYQVNITFTRNSGGYSAATPHDFYVHTYESQPSTVTPSKGTQIIDGVEVATGNSKTISITNSTYINAIKNAKGICSYPPSQSKTYYSVMSGTMKVKFYYKE